MIILRFLCYHHFKIPYFIRYEPEFFKNLFSDNFLLQGYFKLLDSI